jgi:hypothetical protein
MHIVNELFMIAHMLDHIEPRNEIKAVDLR